METKPRIMLQHVGYVQMAMISSEMLAEYELAGVGFFVHKKEKRFGLNYNGKELDQDAVLRIALYPSQVHYHTAEGVSLETRIITFGQYSVKKMCEGLPFYDAKERRNYPLPRFHFFKEEVLEKERGHKDLKEAIRNAEMWFTHPKGKIF